jgi:hypothetical protein
MTEALEGYPSDLSGEDAEVAVSDVVRNVIEGYEHWRRYYLRENRNYPEGSVQRWSVGQALMPINLDSCGFDKSGDDGTTRQLTMEISCQLSNLAPDGLKAWVKDKKPFFEMGFISDAREKMLIEVAYELLYGAPSE